MIKRFARGKHVVTGGKDVKLSVSDIYVVRRDSPEYQVPPESIEILRRTGASAYTLKAAAAAQKSAANRSAPGGRFNPREGREGTSR
jgi:hypothetical protein